MSGTDQQYPADETDLTSEQMDEIMTNGEPVALRGRMDITNGGAPVLSGSRFMFNSRIDTRSVTGGNRGTAAETKQVPA